MRRSASLMAAALLVGGVLLAGCTGTPAPATPKPSPSSTALTAKDVAQKIDGTELSTASLAHVDGTVTSAGKQIKVRIDVEEVRALRDSTMLTWRLSSTSGRQEDVASFQFAVAPDLDTRNIALVVDGGDRALRPYTYRYQNVPGRGSVCLCATITGTDGTGLQLTALMPPLPDEAKRVDVSMPGFELMKAVPVTR
ncbi:hypothetical protein Q9R19_05535 [Microbacterium sp. ARD32]|nr:hypothetical protein [Microbacterium sp. ARD32]MDT0157086.1 hypothetical protein [Microbacterium sp. ARD32]